MILHKCSRIIELGKEIKCEFIKLNNTGARMLDSIYDMTLKLI